MENSPFLPGLILALAVWIVTLLFRILPARFFSPVSQRFPWSSDLAPWILSLGLPYAGLLAGWIASRDFGLTGQTGLEWALGAAAAILLGLLLGWVSVRCSNRRGGADVRDEARWSLYRAAAWPWLTYLSYAVIAGLLASLVEMAFLKRRDATVFSRERLIPFLFRATASGALFLLAHNFFLAMLYYLVAYCASWPVIYKQINGIYNSIASVISIKR